MFPDPDAAVVDACLKRYHDARHPISVFAESIRSFFATHPVLTAGPLPPIHSLRSRMKDPEHLRAKIVRKKREEDRNITSSNLFDEVPDLGGVRVLHLHREQFTAIHNEILAYVDAGHVVLAETPTAITWDPESAEWFGKLDRLVVETRTSHYTSVHYVLRPNEGAEIRCEVQVRTLFEEVWGEIDHLINYPAKTASVACAEQLRVLAKLVGAGSRLNDAIFRSHAEYTAKPQP